MARYIYGISAEHLIVDILMAGFISNGIGVPYHITLQAHHLVITLD